MIIHTHKHRLASAAVLALSLVTQTAVASNVAISEREPRIAVIVGQGRSEGISIKQFAPSSSGVDPAQVDFVLPDGITSFIDVSIDNREEQDTDTLPFVFALGVSATGGRVCAFKVSKSNSSSEPGLYTLDIINCVGNGVGISPFSGISAIGGTAIVSGGTVGLSVFNYSEETGELGSNLRFQNVELPTVIGHPDVILLSKNVAALSTDFNDGPPRFGTMIVDLSGDQPVLQRSFRVADSLGFALAEGPANFPLVNSFYTTPDGDSPSTTLMYTANGALTVQDPLNSSSTLVIDDNLDGLDAVSCSVNQDLGLLVVIGIDLLHIYSLRDDPMQPLELTWPMDGAVQTSAQSIVSTIPMDIGGRATSVASSGTAITLTNLQGDFIVLELDPAFVDSIAPEYNENMGDDGTNGGNNSTMGGNSGDVQGDTTGDTGTDTTGGGEGAGSSSSSDNGEDMDNPDSSSSAYIHLPWTIALLCLALRIYF